MPGPIKSDPVFAKPGSRRTLAALILLIALLALVLFTFSHAGTALVVEDPLEHAYCAVVLGGKAPIRAMEAAKIYKAGWAREVWLTEGGLSADDVALTKLGVEQTPEYVTNRLVLERLGVPHSAIRVIKGRNNNTAEEVQTIARALSESASDRIILVTSNYHTRRVKTLWRTFNKKPEAVVRIAPDEAFDAKHWWRDAADASAVLHEWFGLLNVWTGFRVKSEHW